MMLRSDSRKYRNDGQRPQRDYYRPGYLRNDTEERPPAPIENTDVLMCRDDKLKLIARLESGIFVMLTKHNLLFLLKGSTCIMLADCVSDFELTGHPDEIHYIKSEKVVTSRIWSVDGIFYQKEAIVDQEIASDEFEHEKCGKYCFEIKSNMLRIRADGQDVLEYIPIDYQHSYYFDNAIVFVNEKEYCVFLLYNNEVLLRGPFSVESNVMGVLVDKNYKISLIDIDLEIIE